MKKILFISLLLVGCAGSANSVKSTTPKPLPPDKAEIKYNPAIFSETDLQVVDIDPPQHRPGTLGEKQVYVVFNQPAPFEGILLNPEGMAYIITEHESLKERAELALRTQRNFDLNKLNLEVGKLQLELDVSNKKHAIIIRGREEEINRLQVINQKLIDEANKPWKKILIGAGGILIGAGIGITIVTVAK
jgi:hypothetical protein